MPEQRGNPMMISIFCDTAFIGDLGIRRLQPGILIFINGVPIIWYCERQNTIDTSSFCSEFVALKVGCEMNNGLRYNVQIMYYTGMMSIPIS